MQSIEVCGLTIAYDNHNYISYMELKARLERCFTDISSILKQYDMAIYPICHYVRTNKSTILSIYITDKNTIYAGIYDKNTKSIKTQCSYDNLKDLDIDSVDVLKMRIENMIHSKERVGALNVIIQAWQKCLSEELQITKEDDYER